MSTSSHIYYSPAYTAAAHAFDTTRKAAWIAESLAERPIHGMEIIAPASLSEAQLLAVHDRVYVQAVKTGTPRRLAESNGFSWDPGIWDAVCASNGGAVAAVLDALTSRHNSGSLSSGLHHASATSGAGFCTFNGLALAAQAALAAGASRVLILDLDAHMGDGTIGIVRDWPEIVHADITVCPWSAPFTSERATLDVILDATDYLPTLARRLAALDDVPFDVCLYNAGMDPHEHSGCGGLEGMTTNVLREREEMVFAWAARRALPVAFVLAGGYTSDVLPPEDIVGLHRMTIEACAGGTTGLDCRRN